MFEITASEHFDFLSPEYQALFARSPATAFQHPLWLDRVYARLLPESGAAPVIVTARAREDGRLAMVLPLLRRKLLGMSVIEYADLAVSDYAAPICTTEDYAAVTGDPECQKALHDVLGPFDLFRAKKIRADTPSFSGLFGGAAQSTMRSSAHATRLADSFGEWREARLDKGFRRFLERKRRQLARKGKLAFRCARDPGETAEAFEKMRAFRGERFYERDATDLLQEQACFDFYLDVAVSGIESGFARTHVLCLDDEPIAACFGLSHNGRFCFLLVGYNIADYRNQSVGLLIIEDLAADCIARGDTTLDLTIGDEPYKLKFGTNPTPLSTVWRGSTLIGSIAGFVRERAPRAMRSAA